MSIKIRLLYKMWRYLLLLSLLSPLWLAAQPADSLLMEKHIKHGERLFYSGKSLDSILFHFDKAEKLSEKNQYWERYVYTFVARSSVCNARKEFILEGTFADKTLEASLQRLGEGHRYRASAYNIMGVHKANMGDHISAVEYVKLSLANHQKFAGQQNRHPSHITAYKNLGAFISDTGDYLSAIEYFQQAIRMCLDSFELASVRRNLNGLYYDLAYVHFRLRQYDKAIQIFGEGIDFLDKHDPKDLFTYIRLYHSMANAYLEKGDAKGAMARLDKADIVRDAVHKKYNILFQEETHLMTMVKSLAAQNQFDQVFSLLDSTLQLAKRSPIKFNKSYVYLTKGNILSKMDKWEEATQAYQSALINYSDTFDIQDISMLPKLADLSFKSQEVLETLFQKAYACRMLYSETKNLAYLQAARAASQLEAELIDQMRQDLQAEGSQLFLSSIVLPAYEQAIGIAHQLYELTQDADYLYQAFSLAEKSKAVLLFANFKDTKAKFTAGVPESVLAEERTYNSTLSFYRNQYYQEGKKTKPDSLKLLKLQKQIFQGEQELTQFREKLEENYAQYYQLKYSNELIDAKEVGEKLGKRDMLMLEYFWGDSTIYVFSIYEEKLGIRLLPNTEGFRDTLNQLYGQLYDRDMIESDTVFSRLSFHLYTHLVQPELEGNEATRLMVVRDGMLSYLPFEVLIKQANRLTASHSYKGLPYLFQQYAISYGYSANLYLNSMASTKRRNKSSVEWIGFAPVFEGSRLLAFSESEIKHIHELSGGRLFIKKAATKQNFLEQASSSKIIHLATHAYPDMNDPQFAYLALLAKDGVADEKLYAHELVNMSLQAELAVLSACETGYGQLAVGEGVLSLARAFRYAACSSVLMSLWKAEDDVANTMMPLFYQALKSGMPKDEALQQTREQFLAQALPNQIHPRHWANFVLIGDPAPIYGSNAKWIWMIVVVVVFLLGIGIRKSRSRSFW